MDQNWTSLCYVILNNIEVFLHFSVTKYLRKLFLAQVRNLHYVTIAYKEVLQWTLWNIVSFISKFRFYPKTYLKIWKIWISSRKKKKNTFHFLVKSLSIKKNFLEIYTQSSNAYARIYPTISVVLFFL